MVKPNSTYVLIITFLVFVIIALWARQSVIISEIEGILNAKNISVQTLRNIINNKQNEIVISGEQCGNFQLQRIIDKSSVFFHDIVSDRTIIIKMTSSDCDSCIESLLEILESSKNISDFILLIDKYEYVNLRGRLGKSSIVDKVYVFKPDSFCFKEVGMPYMFFLDSHHRMNNIYIPLKELPDLTVEYLKKKV